MAQTPGLLKFGIDLLHVWHSLKGQRPGDASERARLDREDSALAGHRMPCCTGSVILHKEYYAAVLDV